MVFVCTICTDVLELPGDSCCIPCGHTFHKKCLVAWLNVATSCPICKRNTRKGNISSPVYLSSEDELQYKTNEELKEIAVKEKSKRKAIEDALMESRVANKWLKSENVKYQQEIKDMETAYNKNLKAITKNRNDINAQLTKVKSKIAKMDQLRRERDDFSAQLVKAKLMYSGKQAIVDDIQSQLNKTNSIITVKNDKIDALIKEKCEVSTNLAKANAIINSKQVEIDSIKKDRQNVIIQLTGANLSAGVKDILLNKLEKNYDDITVQLSDAKNTINTMQAEINLLKTNIENQSKTIRLSTTNTSLFNETDSEDVLSRRPAFHSPIAGYTYHKYTLSHPQTAYGKSRTDAALNYIKLESSIQSNIMSDAVGSGDIDGPVSRYSARDYGGVGTCKEMVSITKKSKESSHISPFSGFNYRGYHIDTTRLEGCGAPVNEETTDRNTNPSDSDSSKLTRFGELNKGDASASNDVAIGDKNAIICIPQFNASIYRGFSFDVTRSQDIMPQQIGDAFTNGTGTTTYS